MLSHRLRTVLEGDLRFHFTRPLFWVLVILLFLISWQLTAGGLSIQSGDSTIGSQSKLWRTSEFAVAQMFPLLTFLLYSFFIAVAAGMAIPRDEELGVGPVLHATPLKVGEYIWGKFGAVLALFLAILGLHLLFTMGFHHLTPGVDQDPFHGPFALANYPRPMLFLALPYLLFLTGLSFAVGEFTRRPILVFVAPVVLFLATIFFFWDWSPSWLSPGVENLLRWLEPSGFRWLNETWIEVDLGVEFYNHQPVVYDAPFLLSRLAYAGLGLLLVVFSTRHFAATLRGERARGRSHKAASAPAAAPLATAGSAPLTTLQMGQRVPGFLRTVVDVARFEARNLRSSPGLYIFVPLILLQVIGDSFTQVGAFDTLLLLTPGVAAVGSMNTLTLLVCFLILFYMVESLHRERVVGLAPIYLATPAKTAAILAGKALANSLVGVAVLLAAYLGAAVVMLYEGAVTPSIGPFLLVWGLLLLPTFLVWGSFIAAVLALTRNRYATYAAGLAAMAYTGWKQFEGEMHWVGNWNLWGSATWTDFGALQPNGWALLWNRLFWLGVAAFLLALTVRLFGRREADPGRVVDRLQPRALLATAWRLAPAYLPALAVGLFLSAEIHDGFQGPAAERREEEYHGRNLLTWGEAETPLITAADIDLTLDPDASAFTVEGTYTLTNRSEGPLRRFPMSVGDHFQDIHWTLDGETYEAEDWARLHVFTPPEPLAPGDSVTVGFSHHGRFPDGVTKNGGGMGQFILPAGVVLTSFESAFLPVPFFEPGRGIDEDNRLEPRDYEDDFYHGVTRPGFGAGSRYPVRIRITGPERFQYHSVGVRTSEEVNNGQRTVVWQTDHPVSFFNVVAAAWATWQGDGVSIHYLPTHDHNLEEMGAALEGARRYFSEWFYPYPWEELKLSEFPGLDSYAQGFPTNITFSESIGFLARETKESPAPFIITAHEAAHQWWGNIIHPGDGPGSNLLSEGMAHFSTLLLLEATKGEDARRDFARAIEDRYGEQRRVDGERPLVKIDGSRAGDTTVTYDKGGWAFWMLMEHMGRERALAGIQDFIHRYADNPDHPVLQDFLAVLREHAADRQAYDAFVAQWFHEVVLPQYRVADTAVTREGDRWTVTARVENTGTGRMPVEVALVAQDGTHLTTTLRLAEGQSAPLTWQTTAEPEKIVVDPEVRVLMLKRDKAEAAVGGSPSGA
jgi:ABC-type transport system involved in multi-copper enzyme maturation permease subunit